LDWLQVSPLPSVNLVMPYTEEEECWIKGHFNAVDEAFR
jgi:hypothetical protein